jgi:hypothetical protein
LLDLKKFFFLVLILSAGLMPGKAFSVGLEKQKNSSACNKLFLSFLKDVHEQPGGFEVRLFSKDAEKYLLGRLKEGDPKSQRLLKKYAAVQIKACVVALDALDEGLKKVCPKLSEKEIQALNVYKESKDFSHAVGVANAKECLSAHRKRSCSANGWMVGKH